MLVNIYPSVISGNINAPASKSAMQRALAAALLRNGQSILSNIGHSNDDKAALSIIRNLGAEAEYLSDNSIKINAAFQPFSTIGQLSVLNCGESGLSMRMFTSIAALLNQKLVLKGEGSLNKRPVHFFDQIFPQIGVEAKSNQGRLPLEIKGPLQPADLVIDGSLSSQFLTGLLMAYSAADASGLTIRVENLNSKPYIDLTLKVMEDFGMKVPENRDYEIFYFAKEAHTNSDTGPVYYTIEADWSNAAFLLVAGAISGNVGLSGLDLFSTQADRKILEALQDCGSSLSISMEKIEVRKSPLKAFHFDATDCPDLFPPLVTLAINCKGTSVIEGVHRLIDKESNRALSLQSEFSQLGIDITLRDDKMLIPGGKINSGKAQSHNDHRIAMALAIAALNAGGAVTIEGAEAVNKSYPNFYLDIAKLNVKVQ